MSDTENYSIDTTDAGASDTVSVEAGQIRKGGYIMIKGKPCKVKDVSVSKTGKHGHAKCKFSASDIFTGATCEELCPSTHSIDVPIVLKKDYCEQVNNGENIDIFCTVISAVGQEKITEVRKKTVI